MKDISGKTAFITGGASGIGLGIGKALAGCGARIMLSDIDAAALAKAASDFPGEVETVVLDVRDRGQWAAADSGRLRVKRPRLASARSTS